MPITRLLLSSSLLLVAMLCQSQSYQKSDLIEKKIDKLIAKMSLEEKIGQTAQRGTSSRGNGLSEELKAAVRAGKVGSFLNVMNDDHVLELQKIAIEESPNRIPLIFARDVIHGFKTIFPIPLGQAATWNPELVQKGSRIAAIEASGAGIRWTFAPMLDISRDARWGRIAESPGEDPLLASRLAEAYVHGFQTNDLSDPTSLLACGKHFVGYGAAEAGRDYNTTIINRELLHNVYLKPFKKACESGIATYMSAFNEINGVPATGNKYTLNTVLRDQWKFDGFVVSDWNSVTEMIPHGYCRDEKQAAEKASKAGLDMEMTSKAYENHLKSLIEEGIISEESLDEKVRNILRIKLRMNLFEDPYFDPETKSNWYNEVHLDAAQQAAEESMVLLKNKNLLPLSKDIKIGLTGPLADAPLEQLGTWIFDGEKDKSVTPLVSLKKTFPKLSYHPSLTHSRDTSTATFDQVASKLAKQDIILFIGGEEAILSGEAHSRANIDLPGAQVELINKLAATGKPIILVILAGRPITFHNIEEQLDAVIMGWHPGTMTGPALANVLSGVTSPSGRLPVSWPKVVGQLPMYYNHKNTGRPATEELYTPINEIPIGAWQSSLGNTCHHLDAGYRPHFPFGFGLSYTSFNYNDLNIERQSIKRNESIKISCTVENTGKVTSKETVQLYFQDQFASITRPVKELLDFRQITLAPGESQKVEFTIQASDLEFYNLEGQWVSEPGEFNVWIGPNSGEGLKASFILTD